MRWVWMSSAAAAANRRVRVLLCRGLAAEAEGYAYAEEGHEGALHGTEERHGVGRIGEELGLGHRVVAAFPADDAVAGGADVAVPVGAVTPGEWDDEAVLSAAHDDGGAEGLAGASAAVLDHAP